MGGKHRGRKGSKKRLTENATLKSVVKKRVKKSENETASRQEEMYEQGLRDARHEGAQFMADEMERLIDSPERRLYTHFCSGSTDTQRQRIQHASEMQSKTKTAEEQKTHQKLHFCIRKTQNQSF